jgi:outer membrane protein TolC
MTELHRSAGSINAARKKQRKRYAMKRIHVLLLLAGLGLGGGARAAEPLTLGQALQNVVDTYPSLEVAHMQLQRAQQDRLQVESQLGWILGAQLGASHDLSPFTGTPSDSANLSTSLNRGLASGGSIGITGSYDYVDSSFSFPGLPNPSYTGRVDLTLRKPLAKGAGNPDYKQSLVSADASAAMAHANARAARDQIAQQTMSLFYGAALTWAQLQNARDGVLRAERLKKYVHSNARLGLAEDKDILQSEAQLRAQSAQVDALQAAWDSQRTSLNRLMGRPAKEEFVPVLPPATLEPDSDADAVYQEALAYSPDLARIQAQADISKAQLVRARNASRSQLDLVLGLGGGNKQGPSTPSSVNESDYAASVRLEYQKPLDRRGADASVTQAQLDHSIALRQLQATKDDLRYNIDGLLQDLNKSHDAVKSQELRVDAETSKLKDAEHRYRQGRADTTQLIQFENDLFLARLALEQQRITLLQKQFSLNLLRGTLWNNVRLPAQYQ